MCLGDVAAPGRMPVTGKETVLDAIQYAGGLIPTAAPNNIRLVRPAPPGACCEQTLPVNLSAIISGGDPTTNYQLMPGDRLVVYRDPIVRATIFIDRIAAPFQTVRQLDVAVQLHGPQHQVDQRSNLRRSDDGDLYNANTDQSRATRGALSLS